MEQEIQIHEKPTFEDMALVVTMVYKNVPILYEWLPKTEAYEKAKELTGEKDVIHFE